MIIPYTLQAVYRQLSYESNNSNQVFTAMMHATKSIMKNTRNRNVIYLLRNLIMNNVGTNEVEKNVNKSCKLLGENSKIRVKKMIMKSKVGDAYRQYRHSMRENKIIWRESRRIIPINMRESYHIYILGGNLLVNLKTV